MSDQNGLVVILKDEEKFQQLEEIMCLAFGMAAVKAYDRFMRDTGIVRYWDPEWLGNPLTRNPQQQNPNIWHNMASHLSKILREVIELADDIGIELVRFPNPDNVTEEEADTLIAFGSCLASFHSMTASGQTFRSFINDRLLGRTVVDSFVAETQEHRYYCRGLGLHYVLRGNDEEKTVAAGSGDEEKIVATANEFDHLNEKWVREGVEGLVAPPEGYSPGQYYFDRDGRLIVSLKNQTATAYGALAALKKFPEICKKWADMKPEE